MTLTLRLDGPTPASQKAAEALLAEASGVAPHSRALTPDGREHKDLLGVGIAAATLVLTIPQTITAILVIKDRLARPRARILVGDLKSALDKDDAEARLERPGKPPMDVRRAPIDRVVDWLLD